VTCCLASSDANAFIYCVKRSCQLDYIALFTLFQDKLSVLNRCGQHLISGYIVQLIIAIFSLIFRSVDELYVIHSRAHKFLTRFLTFT